MEEGGNPDIMADGVTGANMPVRIFGVNSGGHHQVVHGVCGFDALANIDFPTAAFIHLVVEICLYELHCVALLAFVYRLGTSLLYYQFGNMSRGFEKKIAEKVILF
jgi:hypothetical protein